MMISSLCEWLKREEASLELDMREDLDTGEYCWECAVDHPEDANQVMVFHGKTPASALQAACVWAACRIAEEAGPMTEEQKEAQRQSLAYGNVNLHNGSVTREMVAEEAAKMAEAIDMSKRRARILYTNHRGETASRIVVPCKIEWKATEHHPEPQWILEAYCCERGAYRSFAMRNIAKWEPIPEGA